METETMVMGIGVLAVLYMIFDILRGSTKRPQQRPPEPGPEQRQPPPQNPVNFGGNFDAESLNKARGIMTALNKYPDDFSKSVALADYLHKEKSRENRQIERRKEPDIKADALLDGFYRLFERVAGGSRRTERPYNTDFMDRGHDYPPQRRTRRIDGHGDYYRDDYPLRDRNGSWK